MLSPFIAHVTRDGLGREATTYSDLVSLSTNYARRRLAGLTVVNRPTQLAIEIGADGLTTATRPGTPAKLLLAIPALPILLEHGRYVGTYADPQRRIGVLHLHIFDANAAVHDGPSFEVRLVANENFQGQCFFDRMLEKRTLKPRREAGGEIPDETAVEQTTAADSPILANAEGEPSLTEPGAASDDECWRRCGHLLPSPSGDRQASEFSRCWRLCKGSLHE